MGVTISSKRYSCDMGYGGMVKIYNLLEYCKLDVEDCVPVECPRCNYLLGYAKKTDLKIENSPMFSCHCWDKFDILVCKKGHVLDNKLRCEICEREDYIKKGLIEEKLHDELGEIKKKYESLGNNVIMITEGPYMVFFNKEWGELYRVLLPKYRNGKVDL